MDYEYQTLRGKLDIINIYRSKNDSTQMQLVCQTSNDHLPPVPSLVTNGDDDQVSLWCLECDSRVIPGVEFYKDLIRRLNQYG